MTTPEITVALARILGEAHDDALQLFDARRPADVELLRRLVVQLEEVESILSRPLPKVIEGAGQQAQLVALIGRAYVVEKEVERIRKDKVAPLNNIVKGINDLFKNAMAELLEKYGKGGLAERLDDTYRRMEAQRLQRERDEALRKQTQAAALEAAAMARAQNAPDAETYKNAIWEAEEASIAQAHAEALAPMAQSRGVKTAEGKVIYHKVWKVEVEDAAQVPRQYLVVDESLLKAAVASGVREIPGCNIFEVEARRRGV